MQNEATDGQADLLGRAQLYGGDWRLARTLPERVRAVSSADTQDFANRYIHNLQVVGLGDTKKLNLDVLASL
jgi:predicted Zn-dependent peptidase